LRAALERLAKDEGLRKRLGTAARAHCAKTMSVELMLDRMEAIYQRAADTYLPRRGVR